MIALTAGGLLLGDWTSVSVERRLDAAAGSFSFSVSRRPGAAFGEVTALRAGMSCTISVDGESVLVGRIDLVAPRLTATAHVLALRGRSATAALVDCCAINAPGTRQGDRLPALLDWLAGPFGVPVLVRGDPGAPYANFEIEQGETVWEAMERACRMRGMIAHDTAAGGMLAERPEGWPATGALRLADDDSPDNIIAVSGELSVAGRFARYIVKGQQATNEWAGIDGRAAAAPIGEAADPGVDGYRPLLILAESQATSDDCRRRAEWEAARRAGRAVALTVTVAGWRQAGPDGAPGGLWDVGQLVSTRIDPLGIDRRLLVAGVSWRLDNDAGAVTALSLTAPEAFLPKPEVPTTATAQVDEWALLRKQVQDG